MEHRKRVWLRLGLYLGVPLFLLLAAALYMIPMPGKSYRGTLPPLTAEERALENRLRLHVQHLAEGIGNRNVFVPDALDEAAVYIEDAFRGIGLRPRRQTFRAHGQDVHNIEVEIEGSDEIVVVGAHYDSAPDCPAANDNGTGVAALLEIAREWRHKQPVRTLRFVAFVNEEPPFFQTAQMGSLVYAQAAEERGDKIVAMLSLETIGYYSDAKGSQRYPFPFGLFYPGTGDFIGFVGNIGSRSLVRRCVRSFRSHTRFPSEGAAVPGWVPGVGWSDHWSFWKAGYEGVMVTDTAPFRYPHYHLPTDTADKIDFARMARVVAGLTRVIDELASG
ncbi:MAG: M28 family peptidase [Planctomycetota bacterium]